MTYGHTVYIGGRKGLAGMYFALCCIGNTRAMTSPDW